MVDNPIKLKGKSAKWWIAGGGAAAIAVVYEYRKSANAAAAAASALPSDTTDTTGTDYTDDSDYSDTGASDAYSDAYDTAAIGSPYSALSGLTFDPSTGTYESVGSYGQQQAQPTTNAQWFQQAETYIMGLGDDPLTASAALGKYMAGGGLTQDQLSVVQTAIAAIGPPPSSVPPPTLLPPTAPAAPAAVTHTVKDGIYQQGGAIYIVSGNIKYHFSPTGWSDYHKANPKVVPMQSPWLDSLKSGPDIHT